MKDLAIIIHGSTRIDVEPIIECIENYKKEFSWADYDIWLCTWKTEDNKEQKLLPYVDYLIADEYSPTQEYLDQIGVPFTQQLKQQPEHKICRISHYSIVYGMDYAFKKIEESGKKYRYALRARNDVYFELTSPSSEWVKILEKEPKAYITPPNFWCTGFGPSDHLGFGNFEVVKNVWQYNHDKFCQNLGNSWNIEACMKIAIDKHSKHIEIPVNKYIIKRKGHPLGMPDWIMK